MRSLLVIILLWLAAMSPCHAAWRVAESAHFRVYGEMPADALRKRVELLEDYRNLLGMFTTARVDDDAPKLTIFLVDSIASAVPFGRMENGVAGFYSAGDRGIAAYAEKGEFGQSILLHEYAHHHMFAATGQFYPAWYVEGFAEYFMTATFQPTRVEFGLFNPSRVRRLSLDLWLPWEQVLARSYGSMNSEDRRRFYAQSWLLTHYLFRAPGMRERLAVHLAAIAKGVDPLAAFRGAVEPDLKALSRTLRTYLAGRDFTFSRLTRTAPAVPAVSVRDLPASADDVLMFFAWLDNRGGRVDDRAAALARVQAAAARHPGDALATRTLALAELHLGEAAKASSLLDGLLASAPEDAGLLRLKAEALLATDPVGQRGEARRLLVRAVKADPADWRAMRTYLRTHDDGAMPDPLFDVAQRMWTLAPQAAGVVIEMATALVKRDRLADAAKVLEPLAFAPHDSSARRLAGALRDAALAGDAAAYRRLLRPGPVIEVK